jgi:hypothetical protein
VGLRTSILTAAFIALTLLLAWTSYSNAKDLSRVGSELEHQGRLLRILVEQSRDACPPPPPATCMPAPARAATPAPVSSERAAVVERDEAPAPERIRTGDEAVAIRDANALLESAMRAGVWTEEHKVKLRTLFERMSTEEQRLATDRVFDAVNGGMKTNVRGSPL